MSRENRLGLFFDMQAIDASFLDPSGKTVEKRIEIRKNPVTRRTCRIAYARSDENEPGADRLPSPPPDSRNVAGCPFCRPGAWERTPIPHPGVSSEGRMQYGKSLLFPNLFPYGSYSAVSLMDNRHFVEIGKASVETYSDCFVNCARYLRRVLEHDPEAFYMAVTQNHLPSAGGSLVHPHLQIQADRIAANNQRFLRRRVAEYHEETGGLLFSDYLALEKKHGARWIGKTGAWEWIAAFAPEGFYELWGILPGEHSIIGLSESDWKDLSRGVVFAQKFYRSLNRNGYNLGVLSVEDPDFRLQELRCVIMARSNYAAWARNDHTGFEVMLGDMATFSSPERTAEMARSFWK